MSTNPGGQVVIPMENHQYEALRSVFAEATKANEEGRNGIVLAQIYEYEAKVAFVDEPFASELMALISRRADALRALRAPSPEANPATDVAEAHGQDEPTDRRVRASSAGGEEP